jgi:hypothetical protein
MAGEFKCEVCGNVFNSAIAMQQHKLDRHGIGTAEKIKREVEISSHELKEQKRKEAEAAKTAYEKNLAKKSSVKKIIGLLAILIILIVIASIYFMKV